MKKLFKFKKRLVPKFNLNKGVFNAKHTALAGLVLLVIGAAAFSIYYKTRAQTSSDYTVYATNIFGSLKTVDSGSTTVNNVSPGFGPFNIAASPDGKYIYAGTIYGSTASLKIYDIAAKSTIKTITLTGQGDGSNVGANFIAVTPDGKYIYTTFGSGVTVIQTSDYTIVKNISFTLNTKGIVADPNGKYIYVVAYDASTRTNDAQLATIDIATNAVIKSISFNTSGGSFTDSVGPIPYPTGITVSSDSHYAYVASSGGRSTLGVFDLTTAKLIKTIGTGVQGQGGVAVTDDGKYAYVPGGSTDYHGYIAVIDLTTNTKVSTISLGSDHLPLAAISSPDGQYIYVSANGAEGDTYKVSYIDKIRTSDNSIAVKMSIPSNGSSLFLGNLAISFNSISQPPATTYSITKTSEIVGKTGRTAQPGDTIKYTITYKATGANSDCEVDGLSSKAIWQTGGGINNWPDSIKVTYTFCNNESTSVSPIVTGNISDGGATNPQDCHGNFTNKPKLSQGTYTTQQFNPILQCELDPTKDGMSVNWNIGSVAPGDSATFEMVLPRYPGTLPDSMKILDTWKSTNPTSSTPDITVGDKN